MINIVIPVFRIHARCQIGPLSSKHDCHTDIAAASEEDAVKILTEYWASEWPGEAMNILRVQPTEIFTSIYTSPEYLENLRCRAKEDNK